MGDIPARFGKFSVSAAGSVFTALGGVTNVTDSQSGDAIDVTDFDSEGWREFLVGLQGKTMSLTLNYDEAEGGQDIVRTSAENGTIIYYKWRPRGDGVGLLETTVQAVITAIEDTSAVDSKVEMTLELQVSGKPTIAAQT